MFRKLLFSIFVSVVFFVPLAVAHPGRTAADGCHYCRTNCASWGEVSGQRHCHGGGSSYSPPSSYTTPTYTIPSCPSYSSYVGGSCVCDSGYAPSLSGSSCVKIPAHAYRSFNSTDGWLCENGYEEVGNGCVEIQEPVLPAVEQPVLQEVLPIETSVEETAESPSQEELDQLLYELQAKDEMTDGELVWVLVIGGGLWYWLKGGGSKN